ncbi:P-loop containing nucleoside triphosphate hydrolase protein, partial [Pisolithus thermaeus]
FKDVADILLATPSELSRTCRITPQEANEIIARTCQEQAQPLRRLADILADEHDEMFTTGDGELDTLLGGGVRTGMLWETVGESAAGKTQLGLQLSLSVQLPTDLGGLSGAACYITVASRLQTTRLEQMLNAHPMLSPSACNLSNIQTVQTPTIEKLIYVLSTFLPQFISTRSSDPASRPLKLIVIDALAELFHDTPRTTTQTLVERSRKLSEISILLHQLASRYRIAIWVLNEVADVLPHDRLPGSGAMSYRDQAMWFGCANSIPGEDRKEASLGLVWANQVNARIFLTRTGRRRYLGEGENEEPTLVRRLSVVFSSVSSPASCDYTVTTQGIRVIVGSTGLPTTVHETPVNVADTASDSHKANLVNGKQCNELPPLDIGCIEDSRVAETRTSTPDLSPEDEWETFWASNTLPEYAYSQTDLGGLSPPTT